jgi:hypothetical protein
VNDSEVLPRRRHCNPRNPAVPNRQRRKKREGKMPDRVSKLRPLRPVPGINRIERLELRNSRALHHTYQIEPRIHDRPRSIRETKQRQHRPRRPDFRVFRAPSLQFRKRENHIANRARSNQQPPQDYFNPYSLRALSRRTIRASSIARSRVISRSRIIPVSAIPSASRPVALAR